MCVGLSACSTAHAPIIIDAALMILIYRIFMYRLLLIDVQVSHFYPQTRALPVDRHWWPVCVNRPFLVAVTKFFACFNLKKHFHTCNSDEMRNCRNFVSNFFIPN
jgi:hypothetical protein